MAGRIDAVVEEILAHAKYLTLNATSDPKHVHLARAVAMANLTIWLDNHIQRGGTLPERWYMGTMVPISRPALAARGAVENNRLYRERLLATAVEIPLWAVRQDVNRYQLVEKKVVAIMADPKRWNEPCIVTSDGHPLLGGVNIMDARRRLGFVTVFIKPLAVSGQRGSDVSCAQCKTELVGKDSRGCPVCSPEKFREEA